MAQAKTPPKIGDVYTNPEGVTGKWNGTTWLRVDTPVDTPVDNTPKERSWTDAAISTGLRVVPAVAGGVVGTLAGPFGTVAGGAAGSALGEYLAEKYENPDQDASLPQVALAGAFGTIPVGKYVAGAGKAALRAVSPQAERYVAGKLASAAVPIGATVFERAKAANALGLAAKGAAVGAPTAVIENTVNRAVQGQGTSLQDVGQDLTLGALIGGTTRVAPKVGQLPVRKIVGTVARLPIFNELPVSVASTAAGLLAGSNPATMALSAAGGHLAGGQLNKVIAAARKLGLPPKAAQPLIRSAAQGLEDVAPLVEELSGFKVFTQDALKQGEKVVTAVTEAKAAGLPVPPQAQAQADRVVAANNVFNVETNTIPEMGRIVADVIDDEAIGGNISRLTAKRAKALLAKVTEGIDAMDRADKPVPEALRQVFEGLQDRLGSESADAMSTIIGAARQGKDALRDAISVLTSTQEGRATYGSIQRNRVTRLALESARRLAANVGGSLTRPSKPKSNQLLDILESMGRRVEEVQVAPERPVGGGFTTPSGVDVVRTGRGAAVSVDAMPEPVLEATAGSSTTSPQAQTPSTQAPAQPRKRSTVQERAVARGAEPVVQSGILTPDEIRAALSNRPGLQVVLDAQELSRNRVRPVGDIVLSRFREGYKALVGKYPKDQSKQYGVSHVAGKFYSGGQNAVNPKETALRKQLLSQFGIEE